MLVYVYIVTKLSTFNFIIRTNASSFYPEKAWNILIHNILPTSRTAAPTTQAKGFPPNVLKWRFWAKEFAISRREKQNQKTLVSLTVVSYLVTVLTCVNLKYCCVSTLILLSDRL